MESSEVSNQLLRNKYDLHKSKEVDVAAKRTEGRTGEKVPQDPLNRIQNYLNRFHEIIESDSPERREHNLDLIKGRFHGRYIIKPDEIPESYFENQRRLAREQGHGDIEITPQMREQLGEVIIADQKSSLDKWIDYLASPDAPYSDGLKYFTLRSVLNMAEYDKEKMMYPQRSKGTTNPFPDLNREALAYVLDAIEKKYKGQDIDLSALDASDAESFNNLVKGENFVRLYAWAIEKIIPASEEELSATKGEWFKYNKGSDHMPLVQSLQGHGTGWCTAAESRAKKQLQGGDFYVYYSNDKNDEPTVPRACIRMEDNRIAEVRGIAKEQHLDTKAVAIVEEKLKEFPDGPSYRKRVVDMRYVTEIESKMKEGQNLTAEDLVFLYEIDAPIEGFGSGKDPRIEELRHWLIPEEDMLIVFGCSRKQIARRMSEIRPDTKAYVGKLEKGIFYKLPEHIKHVYRSFPEGKIRRETIQIGGKTSQQLEGELEQAGINIGEGAKSILHSPNFTTLKNPQELHTVRLKVRDLGLRGRPTTNQVHARAKKVGLGFSPAEAGAHMEAQYMYQSKGQYSFIFMEKIEDSQGHPNLFFLHGDSAGNAHLDDGKPIHAEDRWADNAELVFSIHNENQNRGVLDSIFKH